MTMRHYQPSNTPMGHRVRRMLLAQAIGAGTGLLIMLAVGLWVIING